MDPLRFKSLGPWAFCALKSFGGPQNLMSIDGPRKLSRVHQTWGFGSIITSLGPVLKFQYKIFCITLPNSQKGGPSLGKTSLGHTVCTAWPREVGLIEYMIERVYQGFLSLELHKFGIFWNLHQLHQPTSHFDLGWWKVRGGHPLNTFGLMKVRGGHPFRLVQIPKNAKFV